MVHFDPHTGALELREPETGLATAELEDEQNNDGLDQEASF